MRPPPSGPFLVALLLLPFVLGACGGDDEPAGNASEQAFLSGMADHHQSAIEMAQVAERRAEHRETEQLAAAIISTQSQEIEQMAGIHERLFDAPLAADPAAHEALGVPAEQAGMTEPEEIEDLESAKPFDREFIDMMVSHHQGAIAQAQAVLEASEDPEIRQLAEAIIDAQSREIDDMNRWRTQWYGGPSPAGGVPPAEGGSESGAGQGGPGEHG
jgi:uncharacterized protein (DUF305 family)